MFGVVDDLLARRPGVATRRPPEERTLLVASRLGLLMSVALIISCGKPEESTPPAGSVSLEPFAESGAPYSDQSDIVLVDGAAACGIDSYEVRVYCADPEGRLWAFGQKGEGPGEFMRPDDALRGPGGTFGVIDNPLQRLSLFDTDGALVRTTPLPPVFLAPAPLLANLAGAVFDIAGSNIHLVEVDETTGEIKWRRFFPSDLVQCGDGITPRSHLGFGLPTRSGGLAMVSCRGYSVTWFEDRDDDLPAAVIESPTAVKAEHGDREVEQYIADTRRMAGAARRRALMWPITGRG